jgi:death-on-curing protein
VRLPAHGAAPSRTAHRPRPSFRCGKAPPSTLGLLESALAVPRATYGGTLLHPTLPEIAAAYLFHLVQNHPFVDGNKRIGLAAALAFLGLNDLWLEAEEDELVALVLGVAQGRVGKAEVGVFLKEHSVRSG